MIISPQSICNKLNEMMGQDPEFLHSLMRRIPVSDGTCENTDVMCSLANPDEGHNEKFSSSVLGFINALVGDEHICVLVNDDGVTEGFSLLSEFKKANK